MGEVVSKIPTIGFNVETVQYININFQVWDLGGTQAIIRSAIDFKRDPWPKVSDSAKDLVKKMLNPNLKQHLTVHETSMAKNAKKASKVLFGKTVKARLKQFSIMNKLKKRALRGPGTGTSSELPPAGVIADSQLGMFYFSYS
ncbi:hypothetical protein PVK06_017517 [Gossypium arboreum]|uniref:Uncharacterized protein n=1 Tax=Gossypium arboreum TaxID=29729 RepID=A0ABR0Q2V2_GOSAR|nr:hypothetical protein PVK06_017517 [Gossypium arboreum]